MDHKFDTNNKTDDQEHEPSWFALQNWGIRSNILFVVIPLIIVWSLLVFGILTTTHKLETQTVNMASHGVPTLQRNYDLQRDLQKIIYHIDLLSQTTSDRVAESNYATVISVFKDSQLQYIPELYQELTVLRFKFDKLHEIKQQWLKANQELFSDWLSFYTLVQHYLAITGKNTEQHKLDHSEIIFGITGLEGVLRSHMSSRQSIMQPHCQALDDYNQQLTIIQNQRDASANAASRIERFKEGNKTPPNAGLKYNTNASYSSKSNYSNLWNIGVNQKEKPLMPHIGKASSSQNETQFNQNSFNQGVTIESLLKDGVGTNSFTEVNFANNYSSYDEERLRFLALAVQAGFNQEMSRFDQFVQVCKLYEDSSSKINIALAKNQNIREHFNRAYSDVLRITRDIDRAISLSIKNFVPNELTALNSINDMIHVYALATGCLVLLSILFIYLTIYRLFCCPIQDLAKGIQNFRVTYELPSSNNIKIKEIKGILDILNPIFLEMRHTKEKNLRLLKLNNRLGQISYTDGLTQILNRRALDETIECDEFLPVNTAVLMIDIDHFKKLNDTEGHKRGDDVLRIVAQVLQNNISKSKDMVYRYGGEEFCVILNNIAYKDCLDTADRLVRKVEDLAIPNRGIDNIVTISMGISYIKDANDCNIHDHISRADEALYNAKHGGRNQCRIYKPLNDEYFRDVEIGYDTQDSEEMLQEDLDQIRREVLQINVEHQDAQSRQKRKIDVSQFNLNHHKDVDAPVSVDIFEDDGDSATVVVTAMSKHTQDQQKPK